MSYKKRPKNKQELSPKSGFRPKKKLPTKTIIEFKFITEEGGIYKCPCEEENCRIKVMENGGISCLILNENTGKWIKIKAKLEYANLKTVVIKKEKK